MVKRGQTHLQHAGDTFGPIACPEHRGESVVEYKPAAEPREHEGVAGAIQVEMPRGGVEWHLPVYSEDVGHDPDCRSCLIQAFETEDHVRTAHGLATARPERPAGY